MWLACDGMRMVTDTETHPLLTDQQDPPKGYEVGIIGGGFISFRRTDDATADDEAHHVVIELGGDREDDHEERPVEVWAVTYPVERILMNYYSEGETVGEGVGISEGAEMALEYMEGANE